MYERFVKSRVDEALSDTRVVLISGPRQSGKTTLATQIAANGIPFLTLDDATVQAAATEDPVGFLRGLIGPLSTRSSESPASCWRSRPRLTGMIAPEGFC